MPNEIKWDEWDAIPQHMRQGLERFIRYGEMPGDFLSAIITNNLHGAFTTADGENLPLIMTYIQFMFHQAPAPSWGSKKAATAWCKKGGSLGFIKDLTCCCCSEQTRGRQWWNRDTGYGICPKCVEFVRSKGETEEQIGQLYGLEGVHHSV